MKASSLLALALACTALAGCGRTEPTSAVKGAHKPTSAVVSSAAVAAGLTPVQACQQFRAASTSAASNLSGASGAADGDALSSAQLASMSTFGKTSVHLGVLVTRNGSNAGLASALESAGATSLAIALGYEPDGLTVALDKAAAALTRASKDCSAIGA